MSENSYDIVFSFDTTGSMYPCIREVRRNLKDLIKRLFDDIPGIRIGIIAHGDYCDEDKPYLMTQIDLTTNQDELLKFVNDVKNTCGGDFPEAYEYVLHKAQNLSWNANNTRALVMIGDAYPHEKENNPHKIDWRNECKELKEMGINIYSVQCLDYNNGKCKTFWKQMASLTNGYHLNLDQFSYMSDLIMAVCFQQVGDEEVKKYEQEVHDRLGGLTKGLRKIFDTMLGRETIVEEDLPPVSSSSSSAPVDTTIHSCPPAKFQVLNVDENCSIKQFVEHMGLVFKAGRGFYEFTKPEKISKKKAIVLMKKDTGDLFEGNGARSLVGLIDYDENRKHRPTDMAEYRVFIQSTSYNRKLIANTGFLYEVTEES